ncbi:MAG: hypothetical protein R3F59_00690 [Myxococcota bacterium]
MRLRTRMAVVAAAVALPQLAGLAWWDGRSRHVLSEAGLSGLLVRATAEAGAREACLADPVGWAGHEWPPPRFRPEPPFGPPPGFRRPAPPELVAHAAGEPGAPDEVGVPTSGGCALWRPVAERGPADGVGRSCEWVEARGTMLPGRFPGDPCSASRCCCSSPR